MAEKNRWSWEVSGFEPRKHDDRRPPPPSSAAARRYSISSSSPPLTTKLQRLKDKVKLAKEDYLELRQEAIDLQEYSNAKLDRATRYLGVLADKSRKLDQAALETEARITPLINEKKRLFNELLTAKGSIKVFCRVRPLFEDEGPSIIEFPDDFTLRIRTGDGNSTLPKNDFQFDRVYGPHVGQADLFSDAQPFVQSALDGYNVTMFAFGQSGSGKTHTMEGSSHDRGLYARCFEELFDLSNSDATSTSRFNFAITVFEIYNEQFRDLLLEPRNSLPRIRMGFQESFIELSQAKVDNPLEFSKVLKKAFQNRGTDPLKFKLSHLVITIHIYFNNLITGENMYSKLSLADLAGSTHLATEDGDGDQATDLYVMKSLAALGDVLGALTAGKDVVPYENSMLTKLLADSLGGSSKTLMIVNVCPEDSNLSETILSLNFSSRVRNGVLGLGNQGTIQNLSDFESDAHKGLYENGKEANEIKQEVIALKQALKEANDQCVLLFNEVQKAWKVSYTLQSDLKSENLMLVEKHKIEKDQNAQLRNQVAQLLHMEQEQKVQIQQRDSTIQNLQAKLKSLESQLNEALQMRDPALDSRSVSQPTSKAQVDGADSLAVVKKLEEELSKRDSLIERLHEENEKLFERLTEKAKSTTQVSTPLLKGPADFEARVPGRTDSNSKGQSLDVALLPQTDKNEGTRALVKSGDKGKTTAAGDYLTTALNEFDPEQYDSIAAVADGANKLLMLVLAAVIKAGASREHEILAEIRDAVFSFIRKMEPRRVLDTMLVSRVRILYIRSLLAKSPELQSLKLPPVGRFLAKPNTGRSRSSSRNSSPGRSPVIYESAKGYMADEHNSVFIVNIKPEKKSKLSSVVLKIRGIDQESWKNHVTGGKLREITEEAKSFAIGNKALAALFVHTPAGELQRQIRVWLAENFEFLSVVSNDDAGGTTGQLELLSTAVMDGWMAGLGAAMPPSTDALGQLLSEYSKRVYNSQLQHLKDIAGTLAMEEAEDPAQVSKLRSALESVDHKRRKILEQMKSDAPLFTLGDDTSPVRNPSTAAEDARLASLISLDGIMKQVKDVTRQTSVSSFRRSKKLALLELLDELSDRMPSLLDIDHPCAQWHISDARRMVLFVPEEDDSVQEPPRAVEPLALLGSATESDVSQWNVLQFNTGSTSPFIIKCGANSNSELVIKAEAHVQEPKGGEIVRVAPKPSVLEKMNLDEMKQIFSQLPEALSLLALARTADGTRARYSRLYRTLAMKVPALKDIVGELEKGGALKDSKS